MGTGGDINFVGLQVVQRFGHIAKGLLCLVLVHVIFQHGAGVTGQYKPLVLGLAGQDVGALWAPGPPAGGWRQAKTGACIPSDPEYRPQRGVYSFSFIRANISSSFFHMAITALPSLYYSVIFSSSAIHKALQASLGMRQSPRGDSVTDPTFGPSGRQLRLNCWAKKRR